MRGEGDLHGFVARLVGWTREKEIEQALVSIRLAVARSAHLVLLGAGDLVPIAYALHRRTLGTDKPFVVCDPRRGDTSASVRCPGNHQSGAAAIAAAAGGTLCVCPSRLPRDFAFLAETIRVAGEVQYVVCGGRDRDLHPLLVVPAPILIPPLRERLDELARIVDEYARDAVMELGAREACFTEGDRAWVMTHAATSLWQIEKATLRIVALRASANMSNAAARLGMAPVSLSRWLGRRKPLQMRLADQRGDALPCPGRG
jgi:hypothetical protein